MQVTQAELTEQARDALAHLYDPVALSAHPLSRTLLPTGEPVGGAQGGAGLRRQLTDAIESLKPGPQVDRNSRAWRPYRILQLRYIEAQSAAEVQHHLAMSKSQYYREHESALASLVALLREQSSAGKGAAPPHPKGSGITGPLHEKAAGHGWPAETAVALDRTPETGVAWRWRVTGPPLAVALCVLAAFALFFFNHRARPHVGGPKAGGAIALSAPSTSATLSTFAGTGQVGHVNGPGALAQFAGQLGMSVDDGGGIYVADTGNNRVRLVTVNRLVLDVAGSGEEGYADGPSDTARFSSPDALTVGPDGTVYVADAGNLRVRAIHPNGVVSTFAGSGVKGYLDGASASAQFTITGSIVSDSAGNLYVPDQFNNVIRKITPAGVVSTFAGDGKKGHTDGPPNVAEFNLPIRMGMDAADNVLVGDTGDSRVRKISPSGVVSTIAGTGVPGFSDGPAAQAQVSNDIRGICADTSGNVYVVDAGNRRIREITPDGVVSTLFEFTNPDQTPANMKIDQAGNLYLSDRDHNMIYKLTIRNGR